MILAGQGAKPMLSAAAAAIRRRQALIAGGVLIVVGLGLIGLVAVMRMGQSPHGAGLPEKPVPLAVAPAGAGVDPRDAWRGQEGTRIDRLERSVTELNDLMKRQEAEKQAASRLPAHLPGFPPGLPSGLPSLPPPPPLAPTRPASVVPLPPPTSVPGQAATTGMPAPMPERGIESGEMGPAPDFRPATEPTAGKGPQATKTPGTYHCIVCQKPLFSSETKYDSGCGWPAFYDELKEACIKKKTDMSHLMVRTEVRCSECDSHLGHIFNDGPQEKTGVRYCINSASVKLTPKK